MTTNVLIVGLGNIGSRYLQGLMKLSEKMSIDIIEPSEEAYIKGLALANPRTKVEKIVQQRSLSKLRARYDLVIVATSSKPRADLILNLVKLTSSKAWIIEKVVCQSERQLEHICFALRDDSVWVNTPRRITDFYRSLKKKVMFENKIKLEVVDPTFSIGCNGIHFVDTLEWLVEEEIEEILISAQGDWFPAKRKGFKEFRGELLARTTSGSELRISNKESAPRDIVLRAGKSVYLINESDGFYNGAEKIYEGRLEYQSELMERTISAVKVEGSQDFLPSLDCSARQHRLFFQGFEKSELNPSEESLWPVT